MKMEIFSCKHEHAIVDGAEQTSTDLIFVNSLLRFHKKIVLLFVFMFEPMLWYMVKIDILKHYVSRSM